MRQGNTSWRMQGTLMGSLLFALSPAMAFAAPAGAPESILPEAPVPSATQGAVTGDPASAEDVLLQEPVMAWNIADAQALLSVIESIDEEGLFPSDYQPDVLRSAIAGGAGDALDTAASQSFAWLAEDLRDGRTPVDARVQWFALDPDRDIMPTGSLMATALGRHDVQGVLAGLAPTNPDYGALKALLLLTPEDDEVRHDLIRANMDRWRWLARDMGKIHLYTNVPEFQARLVVKNRIIRSYRTIVGKPGRTATPQLAETVEAVVFNPTWTVPQSIVQGEGLGARLLADPAKARRENYKVTKSDSGMIHVVQQPGPGNALGLLKIDMPNPHAIYMHDTPSKHLFDREVRAFSHGCIRTERAVELGMTMAILGAEKTPEEVRAISNSGKYTRVKMSTTFPVYVTYFTLARDIEGNISQFDDLYGRDKPVIESFKAPRALKSTQRISDEPVIQLDNPL